MQIVQGIVRLITAGGNIGKCPECKTIMYPEKIPAFQQLEPGQYTGAEFECWKCKTPMSYDGVMTIRAK